jgi:hypothetical protein
MDDERLRRVSLNRVEALVALISNSLLSTVHPPVLHTQQYTSYVQTAFPSPPHLYSTQAEGTPAVPSLHK